MAERIYVVKDNGAGAETLVRAASKSGALAAVVSPRFSCAIAKANDVARVMSAGGEIVNARAEDAVLFD